MTDRSILVDHKDAVCIFTLNRPDKLNSFNAEMHRELAAELEKIASDKQTRALVITGAGRAFCAGQDLSERTFDGTTEIDLGQSLEQYYNPLVKRLRSLPIPVITAVNGVAAGAGANIALSGDIVVAARSARFIQAFSRIGLIPDAGGTYILTQRIGEMRAKALAMLATPLSAEQAQEWGLVWQIYDDQSFMDEVMELATTLSKQATTALGLTKQAIHAASSNSYNEQLDMERQLQAQAGKTQDYREGVAAFKEKRDAQFIGK
jgi:2-(1,2-epoxy-1,2-dihydrophenyl)acetyl-CoA isomerase